MAENEMVERVARAIAAQKRQHTTNSPIIDQVWSSYCGQARAAIETMREPTDAMLEVEMPVLRVLKGVRLAVWKAMCGEALR